MILMISKNKGYTDGLSSELICSALAGEEDAQEKIFEHYEPYIIKLSKIPYYNEQGEIRYKIDEDIYMSLKLKLFEVMYKFKVA